MHTHPYLALLNPAWMVMKSGMHSVKQNSAEEWVVFPSRLICGLHAVISLIPKIPVLHGPCLPFSPIIPCAIAEGGRHSPLRPHFAFCCTTCKNTCSRFRDRHQKPIKTCKFSKWELLLSQDLLPGGPFISQCLPHLCSHECFLQLRESTKMAREMEEH